jgi:hypothetical protein
MPCDGTTDPKAATRDVLRGLLAYYGDGASWTQRVRHDGQGRRCLTGALRHVRRIHGIRGDNAKHYLYRAIRQCEPLCADMMTFNDSAYDFEEIRGMLLYALRLLETDSTRRDTVAAR